MARKQKPKARAPKKTARKAAPKRAPKKAVKKAAKKAPKKAVRKAAARPKTTRKPLKAQKIARKKGTLPKGARRVAKAAPKARKASRKFVGKLVRKVTKVAKPAVKPRARAVVSAVLPRLDRERRRLPEAELEDFVGTGADERLLRSARSGHDELRAELQKHTEASLELTAGDVDANWQDAYAIGDEAPGGDSPTPDQDRVDDIGKALGVVYDDDEELMGGEEIAERDAHRWELDPGSKDDEEI